MNQSNESQSPAFDFRKTLRRPSPFFHITAGASLMVLAFMLLFLLSYNFHLQLPFLDPLDAEAFTLMVYMAGQVLFIYGLVWLSAWLFHMALDDPDMDSQLRVGLVIAAAILIHTLPSIANGFGRLISEFD